jgi:serine/threonine-protein kinase
VTDAPDRPADALRALCEAEPAFVERYTGWRQIGCGASSAVVATRLRVTDTPVALKLLWGDARRPLFDAEARALMQVTHPCVMRTHAVFPGHSFDWIELELVEGPTLADALRARRGAPWPLEQALDIGACLAEGLAAVHAAGIVHRDLKPANVLLPRDARPAAKLLDFGIARELDDTVDATESLPGSPSSLSPEALRGAPVGPERDVYALGLILFQILSGQHPYGFDERTSVAQMLASHERRRPAALRALAPGVPRDVAHMVQRALAKRPARRPSADDLAAVLRTAHWDASPGAPAHFLADTRVMLVLAAFAAAAVWVVIAAAR